MNEVEKKILENVFDSLDRLFDRECNVIDVYALLFASEAACKNSEAVLLHEYVVKLESIIRSGEPEESQRDQALVTTNKLRVELNELLPVQPHA
ncbi:hypothetical protein [Pleionea sediminis]|uniref:hypothetical protein n=1 Tax=Pleionea sediminis TaxID=2569479 RepID=UPI001186E0A2|nr:hypothetical protein [Pleionea sediminis]